MSGSEPISLIGFGMRTPLGHHALQSAASWRAGLVRLTASSFLAGAGTDGEGITAAEVPGVGGDRPWTEKALDLLTPAVMEALARARMMKLPARRTVQLYVATPALDRGGVSAESYAEWLSDLRELGVLPFAPARVEVVSSDNAGALIALAQAVRDLSARKTDVAVVCGVDSFLCTDSLSNLAETGRLKTGDKASGLIPGEGAAALVLQRARESSAKAFAHVDAVHLEREPTPIGPEYPLEAKALSRALRAAVGTHAGELSHIFADLNGERWRFLEWGLAETRCLEAVPHGWRLHHPADSMGDLGAAAPLVAVGLYARGLERGQLQGGCLVTAASFSGERAVARLSSPEGN